MAPNTTAVSITMYLPSWWDPKQELIINYIDKYTKAILSFPPSPTKPKAKMVTQYT
jgi:hypothetical protein